MAGPLRHAAALPSLAVALCLSLPAKAEPTDAPLSPDALMTLEGQAVLRDRLWARVLTLGARMPAGDLEDPDLVPWRHGQAVRADRGKGPEVLTAAQLVDGAFEVRVGRGDATGKARGTTSDERSLLATLSCGGPCESLAALPAAAVESWENGRILHFVLPSTPEAPVIGQVLSLGLQGEPFDALVAVTGRAPPGTVLFDAAGLPAAIVVRNHPTRTDRMLAAPLRLPPPPPADATTPAYAASPTAPAPPPADAAGRGHPAPPPAAPTGGAR